MQELEKAIEILDKLSFSAVRERGESCGTISRGKWQNEDIANFNRDVEWLRDFICRMNDAGYRWRSGCRKLENMYLLLSKVMDFFRLRQLFRKTEMEHATRSERFNDVTEDRHCLASSCRSRTARKRNLKAAGGFGNGKNFSRGD